MRRMNAERALVLHIGMNKTGSTSLQQFLYANRELLRERGVLYPSRKELLFQEAHHRLAGAILPSINWKVLKRVSAGGDDPEAVISHLRREILSAPSCPQVVVSSELFAGGDPERAAGYLNRISECSSIRVVVYIRNYVDFLESLLAHQITCNGYDREMVTDDFKRNFCRRKQGYYRRVIDGWAAVVGKENIEVRVLEEKQLRGGGILSDFLSLLGLEMDGDFREIGTKNISFQRNGLEFLMSLNSLRRQGLIDEVEFKVIRWLIRKLPDEENCSLFRSGLREEIREWSREEYEYLAREYLERKDGVLFFDPAGKDLPGGESYRGLDPEFAARASQIITERALEQGAFVRIRNSTMVPKAGYSGLVGRLKGAAARIPGIAGLYRLLSRR